MATMSTTRVSVDFKKTDFEIRRLYSQGKERLDAALGTQAEDRPSHIPTSLRVEGERGLIEMRDCISLDPAFLSAKFSWSRQKAPAFRRHMVQQLVIEQALVCVDGHIV